MPCTARRTPAHPWGTGNTPPHQRHPCTPPPSFSAFIRNGVGDARAGIGQLLGMSGDSAPPNLSRGEAAGPPAPAWARTQLTAEPWGAAAGVPMLDPAPRPRCPAQRDPSATGGWHHGRAGLSPSPSSRLLGFVSPGRGCGCGLHVSPPAPPARGWGAPSVPCPQLLTGTQGRRRGWDMAGGQLGRGGWRRAAPGPPTQTPPSTYEQEDQGQAPPRGWGQSSCGTRLCLVTSSP